MKQQFLTGFCILALVAMASANYSCDIIKCIETDGSDCTAHFGAFKRDGVVRSTEDLIMSHFNASVTILKLANAFGQLNIHRHGFYEYFNKLADQLWEDGMTLVEEFTKRGGQFSRFTIAPGSNFRGESEVRSLAIALEIEKELWEDTQFLIYKSTNLESGETHARRDAHFAHFLVDEIAAKHVDRIKEVSSHVKTLTQLLAHGDKYVALHLYDTEFLK